MASTDAPVVRVRDPRLDFFRGSAIVAGWMERARAHAASQHDTAARVLAAVGLALAEAAVCHRGGDWRGAVAALLPVRGEIAAIGGSHAQRDLFAAMLIDAAGKDRPDLARALLAERRAARPNNRWGALQLARLAGG